MSNIIIRKYMPADENTLIEITKNANQYYINNFLGYNRDKISVAEYENVLAGFLWLSIASGNCQAFIYIHPKYRRLGIGSTLFTNAEKQCRDKNENVIWSMYYEYEKGKKFTDKLGAYYTTSSVYMEYAGSMLPENEKTKHIRKCGEDDFLCCSYLWDKGYYDMQVRIGNPDVKMREPTSEDKKNFIKNITDSYAFEYNGHIIGYGVINGNNIGALAVDTQINNQGYGTILAKHMTNEILKCGYNAAYLWCETENYNAYRVYQKIGYKDIAVAYTSFIKI